MKRLRRVVLSAVLPALAVGVWTHVAFVRETADHERRSLRSRAQLVPFEALAAGVGEYEALRARIQNRVEVIESLRSRASGPLPILCGLLAHGAETLRVESLWISDQTIEIVGVASSRKAVNGLGQHLEERGALREFDVWRYEAGGRFALVGRLAGSPERRR